MRFPALLALMSTLGGCGESFYVSYVEGESCRYDFFDWSGGLTHHLLQGPGDGTFSYDPAGDLVQTITGEYSLESGIFGWDVDYDPDHYLVDTNVQGYGFADVNGDLDVAFDIASVDVLDSELTREVRYERRGCDVYQRETFSDGDVWTVGEYTAAGLLAYEIEYPSGAIVEGEETPAGSVESYEVSASGYQYSEVTEADRHGYARRDYSDESSGSEDWTREGYIEYFIDGSEHEYYEIEGDYEYSWETQFDYEGNGDGTATGSFGTCDIRYRSGDCEWNCGDGWTQC